MKMNVTRTNNQPNVRMNAKRVNNQPNFKASVNFCNKAAQIEIAQSLKGKEFDEFQGTFTHLKHKGGEVIEHMLEPVVGEGKKIVGFILETIPNAEHPKFKAGNLWIKFMQKSPVIPMEELSFMAEQHSTFLTKIIKSDLDNDNLQSMDVDAVGRYIKLSELKEKQ